MSQVRTPRQVGPEPAQSQQCLGQAIPSFTAGASCRAVLKKPQQWLCPCPLLVDAQRLGAEVNSPLERGEPKPMAMMFRILSASMSGWGRPSWKIRLKTALGDALLFLLVRPARAGTGTPGRNSRGGVSLVFPVSQPADRVRSYGAL